MIEGTYDIAVDTPKRHKRGTLALKSDGQRIDALLNAGELEGATFSGTCEGKDFTFSGEGDFPGLGPITYTAEGNVWGNSLTVKCDTSAGKVEMFGTRISTAAGDFTSSHDYLMAASTGEFPEDDTVMYSGLYADGS